MPLKLAIIFTFLSVLNSCSPDVGRSQAPDKNQVIPHNQLSAGDFLVEGLHCPKDDADTAFIRKLGNLYSQIEAGYITALEVGLDIQSCLGGGELGDFYRASGVFFEMKPQIFIETVVQKRVGQVQINKMLTMLPLNTTDSVENKVVILDLRLQLLAGFENAMDKDQYNVLFSSLQKKRDLYSSRLKQTKH